MAKKSKPGLNPLPPLNRGDYFWEATITLPAWKGFQSRLGPYGAKSSKKSSNGTCRLAVTPIADADDAPSAEQSAAYSYLVTHQETIRDKMLDAVFAQYPEIRTSFLLEFGQPDDALPTLDRPDQLRELIGLTEVLIHPVTHEGVAYVGYEFGCAWDAEHGLGVMTHRERIVDLGGGDTAILEWIAEGDAKRSKKKK